jgi:cobalt/nickel transport system permease protein
VVLPFSAVFAAMSWLSVDAARGATLVAKSYVSALAVIFLLAVTPFPELCRAAEWFRAPHMLILLMQFIYRYLFVISEQAQHMWLASRCRGAGFHASAGAVGVLFARSYQRAEGIQRAMFARGFQGRFETLAARRFGYPDFAFLSGALLLIGAARAGGEWLWSR